MNLIGNKVLLREIQDKDMELLNKLINSPEIENNVVGWSKPVSMYEQMDWYHNLKNETGIRYMISDCNNILESFGTCVISKIDWKNRNCSIDIKLDTNLQNKGYGTETIALIVKYIFNELNMNRIFVNILEYNIASQKLFEKNGFIREGIQRQAIYKNGKYNSLCLYSLLKEDFLNERNR